MLLSTVRCIVVLCLCAGSLPGQDSAVVARTDSARPTKLQRAVTSTKSLARRSVTIAKRGATIVFDVDSAVAQWSLRNDPTSRTLRALAPVAFWVPVVAVVTIPATWADEAQDGNHLNAMYARSATTSLALGFVASRTVKHFVRRARPCTGAGPTGRVTGADSAIASTCDSRVRNQTSFFSEHTMSVFAIAAGMSFQAQRQNAPNAEFVTAVTFTTATVLAVGRIYQRHHWLSDVIVGAAVGTASGFLGAQLTPKRGQAR